VLRNYLITALRTLIRNRIYEVINVVGLAVGFAAAIFAALFVRYELTYNEWIPGYQRVYTVATTIHHPRGGPLAEWTYAYRDTARWLKLDFPEVEAAARIRAQSGETVVRRGEIVDVEDYPSIAAADPSIFSVFSFTALAGNLGKAIESPDGLVITRSFARKYFGRDTPLGEVIELDQHPMRVMAVIADLPTNTVFPGSISGRVGAIMSVRAPFSDLHRWDEQTFDAQTDSWQMVFGGTFVRLKQGAAVQRLQHGMADFVRRHIQPDLLSDVRIRLLPISELHPPGLNSPDAKAERLRFEALITGVASIGALILLAACINYINSVTARAARRGIEVGVRKLSGAARRHLIGQFLGESLLLTTLSALIALGLVKLLLPTAQAFLDRTIVFEPWNDPWLATGLAIGMVCVGVAAGLYPAFVLSSFKPIFVLRSRPMATNGSGFLRHGLVGLQFAVLIGITSATAVIYRQATYAMNESATLHGDQILLIRDGCTPVFKAEIVKIPGVGRATCGGLEGPGYDSLAQKSAGTEANDVWSHPVDRGFFDVFDLTFLSGQKLTADQPDGVVINDTARRMFGFLTPAAALGQIIRWKRVGGSEHSVDVAPYSLSRIVGVVADYTTSVTAPIEAAIYYADPTLLVPGGYTPKNQLSVKLMGSDIPDALRGIDQLAARLSGDRPIRRRFLDQVMQDDYRDLTQLEQLISAFAAVALFITIIGLFGLTAFTVDRRTKEVGIRKALGASRGDILRLLLEDLTRPALWANLIALPAAGLLMHRWLQGFVYHVRIAPWMFLMASALALLIAVATVYGHALMVARAKPVASLRYE
jgi:putative ABC transport system permease protein